MTIRIVGAASRTVVVLRGSRVGRLSILVVDEDGTPVDADEVVCSLVPYEGTERWSDTYPHPADRIRRTSTGRYHVVFGDTEASAVFMAQWQVAVANEAPVIYTEIVRVISPVVQDLVIRLRTYIDKLGKLVEEDTPLGYDDGHMVQWLEGGLSNINAFQPYPMWGTLDAFPSEQRQLLVDAAAIVGLTAQAIFAVDTDMPSYSDQGNAFVLDHHPRLMASLQAIATRLDARVPEMKLQYLAGGAMHVQTGPHFRIAFLGQMAPGGAMFRNMFVVKL